MKDTEGYKNELLTTWEDTYKKGQLTLWIFLALKDGPKYVNEIRDFIGEYSEGTISCEEQSLYRALRKFNHLKIVGFSSGKGNKGPDRKYYELTEEDVVMTVFTDSEAMYTSRLGELTDERGPYTREDAVADIEMLRQLGTDALLELRYEDRKRIHHLKYYTWVEQQGKTVEELDLQRSQDYWEGKQTEVEKIDKLIEAYRKN